MHSPHGGPRMPVAGAMAVAACPAERPCGDRPAHAEHQGASRWRRIAAASLGVLCLSLPIAAGAQTARPACSTIPLAERAQARERGACVDAPAVPSVPALPRLVPPALQPIPGAIVEPPRARTPAPIEQPQRIWVPSFVGESYPKALEALQALPGLRVSARTQPSSQAKGIVVDQNPRDTHVPLGTGVTFRVSDGALVAVPSLRGMPIAGALDLLQSRGLTGKTVVAPSSAAAGTVIAQDPAPGREVQRGSTVGLTVSAEPRTGPRPQPPSTVWVPSVIGEQAEPARSELTGAHRLQVRLVGRAALAPRGEVVDQSPREVRVQPGSLVTLFVSDGSLVRVPALGAMPVERARVVLQALDLGFEAREQESSASPPGTVIAQSPPPGTIAARGSAVGVTLAAAPSRPVPPALTWVPNLVGQAADRASVVLRDEHRLRPLQQLRASSAARGIVIAQSPVEVQVPIDAPVTLLVSDGSLVRVPMLQDLDADAARSLLRRRDLRASMTSRRSDAQAGTVIEQDPLPASEVPRGSEVRVVVSAAPAPVPAAPPRPVPAPAPNPTPAPAPQAPPAPAPIPESAPPAVASPPAVPPPLPPSAPEPSPAPPSDPEPARPVAADEPHEPAGGLLYWWWMAAALPVVGAGAWWLRGRRRPTRARERAQTAGPEVDARLSGPEQRPQVVSHEGPALHVGIDVSAAKPAARPTATIAPEDPHA